MDTADLTFEEYWRLYFPDLLDPLADDDRRMIVDLFASDYLDGELPGRETVQRVVEAELGEITDAQYRAWASDDDGTGVESLLAALADPACVDGRRDRDIETLSGFDYSEGYAERIRAAGADGVLDDAEVHAILAASLRNPPLPTIRERPQDVPDLGFARLYVLRAPSAG